MLMMRLQRVGRRNDPSYRIVVTNKRTGPKSDKHVDRIGSYNPKTKQFQLEVDKAREWLAKGVQPSDTMHNLLISQKVIEGKKRNVLPKKSPIVSEEEASSEPEAKETPSEEATEETPAESEETKEESATEVETEEKTEEAPVEEAKEEPKEEEKAEETKEDAPAEEIKEEASEEESKEEAKEDEEEKKD